jgi:cell division protein FtsW
MGIWQKVRVLDPWIVLLTALLVLFGLAMLMSATGPLAVQRTGDSLYYVKHQLESGILPGLVGFFFFALVDYRIWRRFAFFALVVSIVLLVLVFVPGVSLPLGGSHSWVRFGALSFQPSELVKLTFLVYLAAWLAARQGQQAHDIESGLLPFLGSIGAIMLLLILQPDTGSMAVIVGTSLLMYFFSGAPVVWFGMLSVLGAAGLTLLVKSSPYRAARFEALIHPELDPKGIGYHINQAMLAVGSGGWWGLGYGASRQKYLYLPEVEADSIVAVIAEEMGWFVIVFMVAGFAFLIGRCFQMARETDDRFGSYLAAGVGCWLAIQFTLNVGSMIGLLPITGVTLPLVSHGGSAMTVTLASLGLVAGIPAAGASKRRTV